MPQASRFKPAVFLDRAGTFNVPVVRDGLPYPSAAEACRSLHAAGYVLVVATN